MGIPIAAAATSMNMTSPLLGMGHFIHTYMGDGNPLPSFEGEPELVRY